MSVLSSRVLVLNKSWVACGIWNLKHVISKLHKDEADGTPKAKIVNVETFELYNWDDWSKIKPKKNDKTLKTPNDEFKVPEVIVLTNYNKFPKPRLNFSRRSLYKLYGQNCQYCGKNFRTEELTIDHVLPRSQGGKTSWENCVLACVDCNSKKANRTPEQAKMKLICGTPRKPTNKIFDVGRIPCKSWKSFLDAAYWNVDISEE